MSHLAGLGTFFSVLALLSSGLVPGLAARPALAAEPAAAPAEPASADPQIAFERYRLPNGLEVILHPDPSVPLVAVSVWYHVGAASEQPGRSGFAHLFEHMLFQGSQHVGEDRHFAVLKAIGASTVNGTTSFDRTNYYEVVPSHQLATALWLESDRMGYFLPLLTEKSFRNQVEVVRNERRQSYETRPYGRSFLAGYEALYPEGHPARYLVIGRHEELEAATLEDVRSFYRTWYTPSNATLALAGDFEVASARKLIEQWFGSFPVTAKPAPRLPPNPSGKQVRKEIVDPLVKLRKIEYLWTSPQALQPGDAEFDILAHALGNTGTGRLYKLLVHEKQLAQEVEVEQRSAQFGSVLSVAVTLKSDADLAAVESLLDAQVDEVMKEPISEAEFRRAVTEREADYIWGLESLLARVETLQYYNHVWGDPTGAVSRDLDRYRKSTPEQVRATAARHLSRTNRVEILTLPGDGSHAGK